MGSHANCQTAEVLDDINIPTIKPYHPEQRQQFQYTSMSSRLEQLIDSTPNTHNRDKLLPEKNASLASSSKEDRHCYHQHEENKRECIKNIKDNMKREIEEQSEERAVTAVAASRPFARTEKNLTTKNQDLPENIQFYYRCDNNVLLKPGNKKRPPHTNLQKEKMAHHGHSSEKALIHVSPGIRKAQRKEWASLLSKRPRTNDDNDGIFSWLERVVAVSKRLSYSTSKQSSEDDYKPDYTSSLSSDSTNGSLGSAAADPCRSLEDEISHLNENTSKATTADKNVKGKNYVSFPEKVV